MQDTVSGHVICNLQCKLYIRKNIHHNGTHWYMYVLLVATILAFGTQRFQCFHYFTYTGCPRRNVKYFGRVFLMLNYTDITQNTYIQS